VKKKYIVIETVHNCTVQREYRVEAKDAEAAIHAVRDGDTSVECCEETIDADSDNAEYEARQE